MPKPTSSTEWASNADALRVDPSGDQQSYGWSTSDNTISGIPVKPNLQQQNGWQYNVHEWLEYLKDRGAILIAASDSAQTVKDYSTIVCTGTNDDLTIFNQLSQSEVGSVVLLEGTFFFDATLSLSANQDIKCAGKVVIKPRVSGIAVAFDIDGDDVNVCGINLAYNDPNYFESGFDVSGQRVKLSGISIGTNSIQVNDAADVAEAFRIEDPRNTCKDIFIDAKIDYLGVRNLSSGVATGVYVNSNADPAGDTSSTINLNINDNSFFNSLGSFYNSPIEGSATMSKNNIGINFNTNIVNYQPVSGTPAGAPSGYNCNFLHYQWVGGNLVIDYGFDIGSGNANPVYIPMPSRVSLILQQWMLQDSTGYRYCGSGDVRTRAGASTITWATAEATPHIESSGNCVLYSNVLGETFKYNNVAINGSNNGAFYIRGSEFIMSGYNENRMPSVG